MFIMNDFVKKKYKIIVYCALVICFAISAFFIGVKTSQDDIVFELSYDDSISEYYALKEDNTLIWAYGCGRMGSFTYSSYFSILNEQGFVKVSDEDAREMKKIMKKTLKSYEPVPSNASLSVNDSSEIILKYKNKYYNNDFPKEKYRYNDDDDLSIYDMRKKMKKYVKKYKERGAYVYYD